MVDTRDHIQQRGFAIARWSNDGNKAAGFDAEGNVLQDNNFLVANRKTFINMMGLDDTF